MNNPLPPDWGRLTLDQIKMKTIKNQFAKLNITLKTNRNKIIYNMWVSYFDTPNDDDRAKHAMLLFKNIAS
jgi:regulator of RNase E activity RraB